MHQITLITTTCTIFRILETLGNIVINGKSCWIPRREAPQSLKEKHPRAPSAMEQPHQKHFLLHDIPVPDRWLGVA